MWRRTVAELYAPEAIYARFAYNIEHTFPKRIRPPASPARASWANVRKGMRILANLLARVGVVADYRATFWRHAWPLLRAGRIEDVIHIGLVAHHLIEFSRDAVSGAQNASFYSSKIRSRGTIDLEPADLAS